MKDKTKKWLVTAGLAAVCVGLVFGISRTLYQEPVHETRIGTEDTGDSAEIIVDIGKIKNGRTEEKETDTAADMRKMEPEVKEAETGMEEPPATGIDRNPGVTANDREQEIQPEPQKTEEEKPSEPPKASGESETQTAETSSEPASQPAGEISGGTNTQPAVGLPSEPAPQSAATASQNPRTGDIKDGMMYVEGFGWVPYEGGGGQGIYAADMYENGNKIGIMD